MAEVEDPAQATPAPALVFPGLNEIPIDDFMRISDENLSRRVVGRL